MECVGSAWLSLVFNKPNYDIMRIYALVMPARVVAEYEMRTGRDGWGCVLLGRRMTLSRFGSEVLRCWLVGWVVYLLVFFAFGACVFFFACVVFLQSIIYTCCVSDLSDLSDLSVDLEKD